MGRKAYGSRQETAGLPKYHRMFGPGFPVFGRENQWEQFLWEVAANKNCNMNI